MAIVKMSNALKSKIHAEIKTLYINKIERTLDEYKLDQYANDIHKAMFKDDLIFLNVLPDTYVEVLDELHLKWSPPEISSYQYTFKFRGKLRFPALWKSPKSTAEAERMGLSSVSPWTGAIINWDDPRWEFIRPVLQDVAYRCMVLNKEHHAVQASVTNLLNHCASLNAAVKIYPPLLELVPSDVVAQYHEKPAARATKHRDKQEIAEVNLTALTTAVVAKKLGG